MAAPLPGVIAAATPIGGGAAPGGSCDGVGIVGFFVGNGVIELVVVIIIGVECDKETK